MKRFGVATRFGLGEQLVSCARLGVMRMGANRLFRCFDLG
jgi:hypothetical protein